MFGIGPTEMIVFLVILLLVIGPEKLPTFMKTVGKGVRQVRSASRDFKEAIGLDELMREGDPFRSPPVRPPKARPVPVEADAAESAEPSAATSAEAEAVEPPTANMGSAVASTTPPRVPPPSDAAQALGKVQSTDHGSEKEAPEEPEPRSGTNFP